MLDIPIPPIPQLPDSLTPYFWYVAGGAIALGVAMLLWGRHIGRFVLMLAGAGVGYLYGGALAEMLKAPAIVGQIALAVTGGVVCLIAARLVWALLAGALLETVATILLIAHFLPQLAVRPAIALAENAAFGEWAAATGTYLWTCIDEIRKANFGTVMLIIVPAGLLPMMVALIKARAAVVFMTGLIGGLLATWALWLGAVHYRPEIWPTDWMRFLIPAGVALVLTIIGWVYQAHGEATKQEEKKESEESEEKKDEDKVYLPKIDKDKKKK